MWTCDKCDHEYSACLGDDEIPAICECGGKIKEQQEEENA